MPCAPFGFRVAHFAPSPAAWSEMPVYCPSCGRRGAQHWWIDHCARWASAYQFSIGLLRVRSQPEKPVGRVVHALPPRIAPVVAFDSCTTDAGAALWVAPPGARVMLEWLPLAAPLTYLAWARAPLHE